jgi:hypothetical protein
MPTRRIATLSSRRVRSRRVGSRFVEQQHARLGRQGAGERHPLLLAAGDLPHPPRLVAGEVDQGERRADPPGGVLLGRPRQAEGDVLADGEVGEEGVVLEDHAEMTALGREGGDVALLDQDAAAVRPLEAGDQP